jgi:HD-GYP domain-containing protein (c-di-GMP phosphodiesterase class II)
LAEIASEDAWPAVLAAEPEPVVRLPAARLDGALETFADFADLKCTYTLGHSRGVAELSRDAARRRGLNDHSAATLYRAALVHDLGRVAVPAGIWAKPAPLSAGEWELVRLHAYHSERILARSGPLAPLAELAGTHHERADGSGYHRGTRDLSPAAQLLAAADAYQAMIQPRPHRPALTPEAAGAQLREQATAGRLDPSSVDAVLSASGQPPLPRRTAYPAGLTEREVEVLRLIARGETKARVAAQLSISPSTADHHVRHIYDKIGVSTRAGAAVFALQHHLLP